MKKTNISKFVAVGLCICALTGCGASPDEKPDTPNPIVNSNTNEENANGSSENKGNDILDSANLIGSVLKFTDARALASDAHVLLADEPTGNLDETTADEIIALLKKTAHELGKCVVVVTHSKHLAEEADEILEIKNGAISFL